MKIFTINTGLFKLDGGAMHGVVPKTMWQQQNPADENNMCTWAMRCMLVDTGTSVVLIDCGIGDKQDQKFLGRYFLHGTDNLAQSLQYCGYSSDAITDLFLTHLHFDHCGGAILRQGDQLVPAFPNAVYWSDRLHWKTATKPNDREKASFLTENIMPIKDNGRLEFVQAHDGGEWKDGIKVRFMKGHTDSMMLPLIPYKNTSILFCADLIPSAAHVSIPWVMAYDMQPLETLQEKKEMLKLAADEKWVLFFEHDPIIECATVVHTEKGIRIGATFKLADIDQYI